MGKKKEQSSKTDNLALEPVTTKKRPPYIGIRSTIDIDAIDGRTRTGKAVMALKASLREFTGPPTVASELLIMRIAYKAVRLSYYETVMLNSPTAEEQVQYLPMANSLRSDLIALAEMAKTKKAGPTYQDVMKVLCTKDNKRHDS
jgi:hypothetical protein